jgi:hypothetical protein
MNKNTREDLLALWIKGSTAYNSMSLKLCFLVVIPIASISITVNLTKLRRIDKYQEGPVYFEVHHISNLCSAVLSSQHHPPLSSIVGQGIIIRQIFHMIKMIMLFKIGSSHIIAYSIS